jgi:hypothetical protein
MDVDAQDIIPTLNIIYFKLEIYIRYDSWFDN